MSAVTKYLGQSSGQMLIFGGVYSNLQALEAMYLQARKLGIPPSHIICTGDIIGYCAQPAACVDFIDSWGIHAIQGNVEQNILNGADDCGCNFDEGSRCDLFSQLWYPYALQHTTSKNLEFLNGLPLHLRFEYAGHQVCVVHGAYSDISAFIFKSTPWETKLEQMNLAGTDMILAGHCGLPFDDVQKNKYWLNAGVIGMPANDGTTDTWYLLLDDAGGEMSYQFNRLSYYHEAASREMMDAGLPKSYAKTLNSGIWDNCEILPEVEKGQQGITLEL